MKCDICSNENLVKFLKLGLHPPPLNFLTNENDKEEKFPLEVYFCKSCGLVQLGNDVDPNIMFKEYLYTSGVSIAFKKHLELFAKILIEISGFQPSFLILEQSETTFLVSFFLNFVLSVITGFFFPDNFFKNFTRFSLEQISHFTSK